MTKDELKAIKELFNEQKGEILSEVEKKLHLLPTKDEFFDKMDEVMGELKANREEQTLQSGRISEHSDEIEELNQKVQKIEEQLPQAVGTS